MFDSKLQRVGLRTLRVKRQSCAYLSQCPDQNHGPADSAGFPSSTMQLNQFEAHVMQVMVRLRFQEQHPSMVASNWFGHVTASVSRDVRAKLSAQVDRQWFGCGTRTNIARTSGTCIPSEREERRVGFRAKLLRFESLAPSQVRGQTYPRAGVYPGHAVMHAAPSL